MIWGNDLHTTETPGQTWSWGGGQKWRQTGNRELAEPGDEQANVLRLEGDVALVNDVWMLGERQIVTE